MINRWWLTTDPAVYLLKCLETGRFDSTFGLAASFYTELLATMGLEATEAALAELDRTRRMSDFAASIKPVASGLLALVRQTTGENPQPVRLFDIDQRRAHFPRFFLFQGGTKTAFVYNEPVPGEGDVQPRHADIFGPEGCLKLQAVTLSDDGLSAAVQLGLVVPPPSKPMGSDRPSLDDGFTVIVVNRYGDITANAVTPESTVPNLLEVMLGQADWPETETHVSVGRVGLDEALGVHDARGFLADNLRYFGTYLADVGRIRRRANTRT